MSALVHLVSEDVCERNLIMRQCSYACGVQTNPFIYELNNKEGKRGHSGLSLLKLVVKEIKTVKNEEIVVVKIFSL